MTEGVTPDWPAIAHQLYREVTLALCRCQFERTRSGVPIWKPIPDGQGISRTLIVRCSNCAARNAYEAAAGLELTGT